MGFWAIRMTLRGPVESRVVNSEFVEGLKNISNKGESNFQG